MTFRTFTPLLSIAGQGKKFSLVGACFRGSNLHELGSKLQPHKARDKRGKKVKGENFSVLPGGMKRLKPNTGLQVG